LEQLSVIEGIVEVYYSLPGRNKQVLRSVEVKSGNWVTQPVFTATKFNAGYKSMPVEMAPFDESRLNPVVNVKKGPGVIITVWPPPTIQAFHLLIW
jgi:hypothetical protein